MPNLLENVDTIVEEVLEDLIAAVVSDSSQIETTVQSVLLDIVAMKFRHCLQLDTDTDNVDCKDRRKSPSSINWSTLWSTLCRKHCPPRRT
ncbi:unnamed protein product [Macrosiphum euphorbiae]|uniref:Uncharacterized protein n=1 Tax=Macrosiphum euphorbiae TaxID=13131 RepID=A0AAV0VQM6_9HEMI|nr:unnamed protein product [Macrosiphum euphorbiae]